MIKPLILKMYDVSARLIYVAHPRALTQYQTEPEVGEIPNCGQNRTCGQEDSHSKIICPFLNPADELVSFVFTSLMVSFFAATPLSLPLKRNVRCNSSDQLALQRKRSICYFSSISATMSVTYSDQSSTIT